MEGRSVPYTRFTDARGCAFSCSCSDAHANCSCTSSGCGVVMAQSCNESTFATIPVVNSCQGVASSGGASTTWGATLFGYTATVTSGCTAGGSSAPVGGLTVTEPQTLCCM